MDRDRSNAQITELLARARNGDQAAFDQVYSAVYEELRRLARARRRKHLVASDTMNTTALVHETYLKLCKNPRPSFNDREHFMAVSAAAMRQILVDEARRRLRTKRGGGVEHRPLDEVDAGDTVVARDAATVVTLHEALKRLGADNQRLERVIEYRFFGGMTEAEVASVLGCTERTIRRDWVKARAWLQMHLDSPATDA